MENNDKLGKSKINALQSTIINEVDTCTTQGEKCANTASQCVNTGDYETYLQRKNRNVPIFPFLLLFFLFLFSGCRTYVPVETSREINNYEYKTEYVTKVDSIYERDSIFVDRWVANDTIYSTKYVWKYKYKEKIDTLILRDTITVTDRQEITKVIDTKPNRWVIGFMFFLMALSLLSLIALLKGK